MSLTATGIDKTWKRAKYLLAVREMPGHHNSASVKRMVDNLLEEWAIDRRKVCTFLHDEGSNMLGVIRGDSASIGKKENFV